MEDAADLLLQRFGASRRLSETLAAPLSDEDMTVQASDDASPTKWHLAHTTWFYEAFVLVPRLAGYRRFSPDFDYCFNSYYNALGRRQPRGQRGLLTRPAAAEVRQYRVHVDAAVRQLLREAGPGSGELAALIELGINHEQQHQELLLTDILALFAANPLRPAYAPPFPAATAVAPPLRFRRIDGGIHMIGHDGAGFGYDNEHPSHAVMLRPFAIASRCVTNREWIAFIEDAGYGDPRHWLADGWAAVERLGWAAPGYWQRKDGAWHQMTLSGLREVDLEAPVSHVSFYEADAFARWSGKRLPTEAEWETAARQLPAASAPSARALQPRAGPDPGEALAELFGQVWQWTQSAYLPYPGYRAEPGAIGEYNGKFMSGQQVLRGSSCLTPAGHSRATYRNFFYPHQRWQMCGLRLAEDIA